MEARALFVLISDSAAPLVLVVRASELRHFNSMPRHERGFYNSGECFKQLPLANGTRHSDDVGSASGAADGTEG